MLKKSKRSQNNRMDTNHFTIKSTVKDKNRSRS